MTVVEEHASPDVIVMILGNKADMTGEKVVKTEQGERLAKVSFILSPKSEKVFFLNMAHFFDFFYFMILLLITCLSGVWGGVLRDKRKDRAQCRSCLYGHCKVS